MSQERLTAAEFASRYGGGRSAPVAVSGLKPEKELKAQIKIPALPTPNKTEQRLGEYLSRLYHPSTCRIRFSPWCFILPSGTRYTPDWVVEFSDGRRSECWECKGPHIHDPKGALRAIKEAASSEIMFQFVFAQWRGEWCVEKFHDYSKCSTRNQMASLSSASADAVALPAKSTKGCTPTPAPPGGGLAADPGTT